MKFYFIGSFILTIILFTIFIYSLIQYWILLREKKIKSLILLLLRSLTLIILIILILEPFYFYYKKFNLNEKFNIYIDNSKSIGYSDVNKNLVNGITDSLIVWTSSEDINLQILYQNSLNVYICAM